MTDTAFRRLHLLPWLVVALLSGCASLGSPVRVVTEPAGATVVVVEEGRDPPEGTDPVACESPCTIEVPYKLGLRLSEEKPAVNLRVLPPDAPAVDVAIAHPTFDPVATCIDQFWFGLVGCGSGAASVAVGLLLLPVGSIPFFAPLASPAAVLLLVWGAAALVVTPAAILFGLWVWRAPDDVFINLERHTVTTTPTSASAIMGAPSRRGSPAPEAASEPH